MTDKIRKTLAIKFFSIKKKALTPLKIYVFICHVQRIGFLCSSVILYWCSRSGFCQGKSIFCCLLWFSCKLLSIGIRILRLNFRDGLWNWLSWHKPLLEIIIKCRYAHWVKKSVWICACLLILNITSWEGPHIIINPTHTISK